MVCSLLKKTYKSSNLARILSKKYNGLNEHKSGNILGKINTGKLLWEFRLVEDVHQLVDNNEGTVE